MNDMVDLDSDVFDEIELLTLVNKLQMSENTIHTINGTEIIR